MSDLTADEKRELLDHISLGTDETFYFPYNNGKEPLPLRPLTSYELDKCFYKALANAPSGVAEVTIKIKLGILEEDQELGKIEEEQYVKLQKYNDDLDYWIVYYAMKDFQDADFKKPNYSKINEYPNGYYTIKENMKTIHKIADKVIDYSYKSNEIIKKIFYDEFGKQLAIQVTYLNQSLGEIDKLTQLQKDFLIYSKGHLKKVLEGEAKKNEIMTENDSMKLKDFLKRF